MPAATLPDAVREQRPGARGDLERLAHVSDQIESTRAVTERLLAERKRLWTRLRRKTPPVSWADIARVSGVDSVTVIQAVQGRKAGGR